LIAVPISIANASPSHEYIVIIAFYHKKATRILWMGYSIGSRIFGVSDISSMI
jgi:hypothetical protein